MLYIAIRKTLDWDDREAFLAQLPGRMREGVQLWNETFSMPYHIFRGELKRIAGENLSAIEGAECAPLEDVPEGALVAPVDDDDWFSPALGAVLGQVGGEMAGCYWPSRFLEVPISLRHELGLLRRSLFPGTPRHWQCNTNNYAIRWEAGRERLVYKHTAASRWFQAHPAQVVQLAPPLSLMNRSLASTTQLRSKPPKARLLRKYNRYRRLYREPLPPDLDWAAPHLAKMRDLHDELLAGRPELA